LNRSLGQSAAKIWLAKICPERVNHTFFVTSSFLLKIWFLSHHFSSRYARKPFKGSNNADFGFVSRKTGAKKWPVGAQSQVNSGPKR